MNDKVVSDKVKVTMAAMVMLYESFDHAMGSIFADEDGHIPNDMVGRFETLMDEWDDVHNELERTVVLHLDTDLTYNGCLAILLDMGRSVQCTKTISDYIALPPTNAYKAVIRALDRTAQMVVAESFQE